VAKLSKKAASLHAHDPPSKGGDGDSDDEFLGMTTLDVTSLLTGKHPQIDTWFTISGAHVEHNKSMSNISSSGSVRIVVEYEPTDPPPRGGDVVRLTRFCNPKDLFPISPSASYRVHHSENDQVILSYKTIEGWQASFQVHRCMLLCEQRYQGAIEYYQDELTMRTERFTKSIVAREVQRSVEKAQRDGIVSVGVDALKGGMGLLGRWFNEGLDTAVGDIVSTTNWDGRHQVEQESAATDRDGDDNMERKPAAQPKSDASEGASSGGKALPGMPSCPITGFAMMDPVVAADGHTYERSAIARWLQTSDKSPLTGEVLVHKELVPNYMLLSSLRERKNGDSNDSKMPPASEGDKKFPPPSAAAPVAIVTTDVISDAGVSYPTLSTLDGALGDTEDTPESSVANDDDVGRIGSLTAHAFDAMGGPGLGMEDEGAWHALETPMSMKGAVPTEGIVDDGSSVEITGIKQNSQDAGSMDPVTLPIADETSEVSDMVATAAAGTLSAGGNAVTDGEAGTEGSVSTVTLATNAPFKARGKIEESVRAKACEPADESKPSKGELTDECPKEEQNSTVQGKAGYDVASNELEKVECNENVEVSGAGGDTGVDGNSGVVAVNESALLSEVEPTDVLEHAAKVSSDDKLTGEYPKEEQNFTVQREVGYDVASNELEKVEGNENVEVAGTVDGNGGVDVVSESALLSEVEPTDALEHAANVSSDDQLTGEYPKKEQHFTFQREVGYDVVSNDLEKVESDENVEVSGTVDGNSGVDLVSESALLSEVEPTDALEHAANVSSEDKGASTGENDATVSSETNGA